MAVDFRILTEVGVVYVRYWGIMGVEESRATMEALESHSDFRHGMRQLVDLSAVTDWDHNFVDMLKMQAEHITLFQTSDHPTMVVNLAPTPKTQSIARTIGRSWEAVPGVISLISQSWDEAMDLMGVDSDHFRSALASDA